MTLPFDVVKTWQQNLLGEALAVGLIAGAALHVMIVSCTLVQTR